jgi:signal transduction histidine kinase
VAAAAPGRRPATVELRLHSPEADLLVEHFPVRGDKEHEVGVMPRDVTRERELIRAKDELVSIVSHELRGPLSNIIDDFLDLQRVERGVMRTDRKMVELSAILDRLTAVAPADEACPLAVEVAGDVEQVFAGPQRVLQVLLNLVGNARKYSHDGLGIEAGAIPRLFGEFYRVQTPDRQGISGTGLALSICRKIIRAHQGEIRAESDGPGQGTQFHFMLPVADPAGRS